MSCADNCGIGNKLYWIENTIKIVQTRDAGNPNSVWILISNTSKTFVIRLFFFFRGVFFCRLLLANYCDREKNSPKHVVSSICWVKFIIASGTAFISPAALDLARTSNRRTKTFFKCSEDACAQWSFGNSYFRNAAATSSKINLIFMKEWGVKIVANNTKHWRLN